MTRSERLFFITQLVKHCAPITVEQLVRECGLSKRIICSDVNSLSELDVPIFSDPGKGYRLAKCTEFELGEIDAHDADLILFCLYHNPLNKSPVFRRRIMFLKDILQNFFESSTSYEIDSFFLYDASYKGFSEMHKEMILKFVFALFSQNYVQLTESREFLKNQLVIPIGIKFKGSSATFVLYSEDSQNESKIDIEYVEAVSISPNKFTHHPKVDLRPYGVHEKAV